MALSTTTAAELTQEQVQKVLIKPLEDQAIFLNSGARVFDSNGSPVRIPKLGGATKPTFVGENELIPEVDTDFEEVQLLPSTMKSVKVITRFSNELARQSVVSLDAAMRDRLVKDVADTLDYQLLSDGGDGVTTPKGLFAYEGTQKLDVKGKLTLDHLLTAWGMALAADVNMSSLKWVITPEDFVALRGIKDSTGQYIVNADPTADAVFRLFGAPVTVSKRVPNKTTGSGEKKTTTGRAALVDFSQIAVARDMTPTVTALQERYADYDQVGLRVITRYDAAPLNPEAIVALEGITRG